MTVSCILLKVIYSIHRSPLSNPKKYKPNLSNQVLRLGSTYAILLTHNQDPEIGFTQKQSLIEI
jgi:hypothetical protein